MASKETTAVGFVNVSREITGELKHEFFFLLLSAKSVSTSYQWKEEKENMFIFYIF